MGTTTTNLGLYKPTVGESGWGDEVNANFDLIDLLGQNAYTLHVHPSGDNANDGLTWATAKKDILGAYDALPAGGGTIYFAHGTYVDATNTDRGLWIAGSGDSAYASLPTGWRQSKRLHLIGVGAASHGFGAMPAPVLYAGSTTDTAKPGIWLSGTNQPMVFENILLNNHSSAQAIQIGLDSSDASTSVVANKMFRNVQARTNQVAGLGPVVHITSAFWIWFEHFSFSANEQEAKTSDKRANVLCDGSSTGAGLIYFKDGHFNGGAGFKINGDPGSTNFIFDSVTQEGSTTPGAGGAPIVWVNCSLGNQGHIICRSVESSDRSANTDVAVVVLAGNNPEAVILDGVTDFSGPCTVVSLYKSNTLLRTVSLAGDGAIGFAGRTLTASHEGYRRAGAPSTIRYINKAATDVTTWSSKPGGSTVTTGKADPFGGTNAAELSSTGVNERQVARFSQTIAAGDWFIGGVWVRTTANNAPNAVMVLDSANTNNTAASGSIEQATAPFLDDTWHWVWGAVKWGTIGTPATELIMGLRSDTSKTMQYAYPVCCYIPVTDNLDDSEVFEMAMHLQAYPDTVPAGAVSTLRSQKLIAWGGIGVGNSASATTPGSVVKKMEVFDQTGASLGYVPIYSSIT